MVFCWWANSCPRLYGGRVVCQKTQVHWPYLVSSMRGSRKFCQRGSTLMFFLLFLCPQRNFGRHIVIAPSVRLSVHLSVRPSRFRVRSISPIFFEVGIPNLVCGYILGWQSVTYHFRVTVTLTSDLVFRIIVSEAYLLYYLR